MAASEPFWPPYNLPTGQSMPAIGFGMYQIKDRDTIKIMVDASLKAGYRSFDIAALYNNEAFLGEALRTFLPKYDLTREDVFITSKLDNAHHGSRQRVIDNFEKSETLLGYTPDLYLIHFPRSANMDTQDKRNRYQRHLAWGALTELYEMGRVYSIGVSNFGVGHLQELQEQYHSDVPVVNQVEWHPLCYDEDLLEYCNKNSILLQGYHSLGGTKHSSTLLKNTAIKEIADDHSVNSSQVLLTWSLQRGVAVIPKSTNTRHIVENIDLNFRLTDEQMHVLDHFSSKKLKYSRDLSHVS